MRVRVRARAIGEGARASVGEREGVSARALNQGVRLFWRFWRFWRFDGLMVVSFQKS